MNWLQRLVQTRRMENDLDKELRFHFQSQVEEKVAGGASEAEARRLTRLEFGGLDQVKEDCRESRGTMWIHSIFHDLRFGARILIKSPIFACTAILVLALGIGVNTLAFSLYNLVALQTLPVRDPGTLVNIQRRSPENITPAMPYASIVYYGDNAKSLSAVMATMNGAPTVFNRDEERVHPAFVTSNYFAELGATAAAGRLFEPSRDTAGSAPVAVLSYRFLQRKYNGDGSIVGKTISLAGKPATVIGVTPKNFANLGTDDPDLWLPLPQHPYFVDGSKPLTDPAFDGLVIMWGRLARGVSASAAAHELLELTNQLRKIYPAVIWDHEYITLTPGAHIFSFDEAGMMLAIAAPLVLLILGVACANLGGLLMARGVTRQREIHTRLALGASRSRIFRQLLTESVLLGLAGSIAALPLSCVVLRLSLQYTGAPAWMSAMPDWRVLLFTAVMGFVAAVFFGFLPTLQMVRPKKSKSRGSPFVVGAQVAASCVLLILAGLLVRATLHTLYTDPGFQYEQVLSIDPALHNHGYTPVRAQAYLDELQSRLRALPGVSSVSMAMTPPLVNEEIELTTINAGGHQVMIYPNWVGREFFQTMGIPLLRGRYFRAGEKNAVILSQSLARKRWPNEDPLGKRWKDGKDIVVGVVGNTRAMEINNTDATEIYYPPSAEHFPRMFVLVKTSGAPGTLSTDIRTIAASLDPTLYPSITPLTAGFRKNVRLAERIAAILSALGGIAVFLAVVGLLGLVSYAVSQRTREIAIRLALGADRREISTAILQRFAWPIVIGLVAGVALTAASSQILRRMLYGVSGLDPISYLGALSLLTAVLVVAALLPTRQALKIDVARILQSQ